MGAQKSLNASEISSLIKENIEKFEVETLERTEGQIVSSSDGIVSIHGLENVQYGERIQFDEYTNSFYSLVAHYPRR